MTRLRVLVVSVLIFYFVMPPAGRAAPNQMNSPFCNDCIATQQFFRQLCDFVSKERPQYPVIFVGGYYMRTLVAGYEIFGDRGYLKAATAYTDWLLNTQSEHGYWGTGYGSVYLADTGSAIGLFLSIYKHVDRERQRRIFESIQRYVNSVEADELIGPSGAMGVGWETDKNGKILRVYRGDYTISTSLTGAQVFTWMYHITGKEKYRRIAYNSVLWILDTMRDDGVIPYVQPGFTDYRKKGDPRNDIDTWEEWRFNTSAYVGEGIIAYDLYSDKPQWKAEIRRKLKPHIDYLVRSQDPLGFWGVYNSEDQKRSPGVVNFLTWYYLNVEEDPHILTAVRKYDRFLMAPAKAKAYGIISAGGDALYKPPWLKVPLNEIITATNGRAVADILLPLVDARW